jgi:GT2 family glycosyltransferase
LASLADELPGGRVVVVDNGSGDGSAETLAEAIHRRSWGEWVQLLPLDRNAGFAAGNNAALRQILAHPRPPDYFWLLNPDTVVRVGAGRVLAEFLNRHPRVGIVGSRLEQPDGTPQRSAFRFPSVLGEWENGFRFGPVSRLLRRHVVAPPVRAESHPTDWLSGASLMVRRSMLEQVGLLDEGFFLYFEEVDLCRRAARAGWRCWYVPESRVVHLVSQSTGVDGGPIRAQRKPEYWFASRQRYFAKHHPRRDAACADVGWAVGFAAWRLRNRFQRKPDTDPPGLLGDFVRYNFLRPRRELSGK